MVYYNEQVLLNKVEIFVYQKEVLALSMSWISKLSNFLNQ